MDERWALLGFHDLCRIQAGGTVRIKVRGTEIEIVLWGAAEVQRIVTRARAKVKIPKKATE